MRILICDDEIQSINELETYIDEYMKNHLIKCDIDVTTAPKTLLRNDISYDLAFLDI